MVTHQLHVSTVYMYQQMWEPTAWETKYTTKQQLKEVTPFDTEISANAIQQSSKRTQYCFESPIHGECMTEDLN